MPYKRPVSLVFIVGAVCSITMVNPAAGASEEDDPFEIKKPTVNRCYWLDSSLAGEGLCGSRMRPDTGLLKKEASKGNSLAAFRLGQLYTTGSWGVKQDRKEALKWYRVAAQGGKFEAQVKMGIAYEFGRGVDQDLGEAIRWYELAVEQGIYPHLEKKLDTLKEQVAGK